MPKCQAERLAVKEALEDFEDAADEWVDAYSDFVDVGGPDSGTSAGEVGAIVAGVAACVSNPFSWVACGVGFLGIGVVSWEDSHSHSEKYEEALEELKQAEEKWDKEHDRYYRALNDALDCLSHELTKIHIPPTPPD